MWFGIVTLFPEMFDALDYGVTGRAIKDGRISLSTWNPRHFTTDKHQTVDDRPYGGGAGMVMMTAPLLAAIEAARVAAPKPPKLIYLSPQGRLLKQTHVATLANDEAMILISGRYEGIDERIIQQEVDEEWSIGDYVVSGGELASMVMIDAIARLLPGVLGNTQSATEDSITSGLLKYPQFTRPESIAERGVPEVLLSGHHQRIDRWRLKESLGKTWLRRPDLLAERGMNADELALLTEFINEFLQK